MAPPRLVHAAVTRDLAGLADRGLARSALAVSALALAAIIDDKSNSAASRTAAARELREALDRLRELAPPETSSDQVDGLQSRARLKLAGSAGRKPAAGKGARG